ncbi:hypothetical protein R1flu_013209 [Riccia fluitans]|uniref:Uncharacterized protein n=1 Tax=Riccia fluitans TaxID=41844 RepID=A0ABD1YCV6_9MARC
MRRGRRLSSGERVEVTLGEGRQRKTTDVQTTQGTTNITEQATTTEANWLESATFSPLAWHGECCWLAPSVAGPGMLLYERTAAEVTKADERRERQRLLVAARLNLF